LFKNKIIYITHEDDKYGAAQSFLAIILSARNYGFEPIVIAPKRSKYNLICDKYGIENYSILYKRCSTLNYRKTGERILMDLNYRITNAIAIGKIVNSIDTKEVCLIHVNSVVIDLGIKLSKKLNIPLVWHIREFLELDFNQKFYRKNQISRMNNVGAHYVFISKAIRNYWTEKGIKSNNKVIYNGVRNSYQIEKGGLPPISSSSIINVIFVGHITPEKGQWQVIEAMTQLSAEYQKRIKIDFYGDGASDYIKKLQQKVLEYHLENVICFKGYYANISEVLSNYQIGVIASKAEGFGRVTIEYMQAGLCVIASNTGANIELIENKKTGILYEYANSKDLADQFVYLLNNIEQIKILAKQGKENALSNFSEERYVWECMKYYKEILNGVEN